jgi:hypothetical protein
MRIEKGLGDGQDGDGIKKAPMKGEPENGVLTLLLLETKYSRKYLLII